MRLIDADTLMEKVCEGCPRNDCTPDATDTVYGCMFADSINSMPTIEAKPVRHGWWKKKNGEIYCTNCKKSKWSKSFELMLRGFDFCPNCGARMDLSTQTEAALDMADSVMMGGANDGS